MDAFNLAFHLGYTLMVCTPSAVVRYQWSLLCNKFRPFFFNNTFLFVCFLNWNLVGCFVALLCSFTVELWSCSHWRGKWNGISYFTWESFCALLISKQTFFWFNWKTQFQGPRVFPEEYFHLILQISSTCNYWGGSCVVGKAGLTELHSVPRTWVLLLSVQAAAGWGVGPSSASWKICRFSGCKSWSRLKCPWRCEVEVWLFVYLVFMN